MCLAVLYGEYSTVCCFDPPTQNSLYIYPYHFHNLDQSQMAVHNSDIPLNRNFLIWYVTLCVGGSKASAGQYLDIAQERGQYPDIAQEGGFQLSFDPPFDPTFHL